MVQEFYVLKCFSCENFQNHIVKKSNKWECKVCGIKQSIKKVYGRGSAKDCRLHTQKLNALKGQIEEIKHVSGSNDENYEPPVAQSQNFQHLLPVREENITVKSSKWTEFVDEEEQNCEYNRSSVQDVEDESVPLFRSKVHKRKNVEENHKKKRFAGSYENCEDSYRITFNHLIPAVKEQRTNPNITDSHNKSLQQRNKNFLSYDTGERKISAFEIEPIYKNIQENSKDNECSKINHKRNIDCSMSIKPAINQRLENRVGLKWAKYLDTEEEKTEKNDSFPSNNLVNNCGRPTVVESSGQYPNSHALQTSPSGCYRDSTSNTNNKDFIENEFVGHSQISLGGLRSHGLSLESKKSLNNVGELVFKPLLIRRNMNNEVKKCLENREGDLTHIQGNTVCKHSSSYCTNNELPELSPTSKMSNDLQCNPNNSRKDMSLNITLKDFSEFSSLKHESQTKSTKTNYESLGSHNRCYNPEKSFQKSDKQLISSLPVFEQDVELDDSNFQLDF